MNLSLKDIASGISWNDEGRIYLKPKSREYELLTEYIENYSTDDLKKEIISLKSFSKVRDTKDKTSIENYIMNNLMGFTEHEDREFYAYIAGATDFTITVLYDLKNDMVFLNHPYGGIKEKYVISEKILILFLNQILKIRDLIILKLGEN